MTRRAEVGILALQGDFAEHAAALQRQGLGTRLVRRPADLAGLSGLVLPGGESTTMLRLLQAQGLEQPLTELLAAQRVPVLATCAGLILLARKVSRPEQRSFGVLDVDVERNAYGPQIASGVFPLHGDGVPPGTTGVFIRAPRVVRAGPDVEVLARRDGDPVLVRDRAILGACFHPELDADHPVTRSFVAMVRGAAVEQGSLLAG
ncbi:MAG TPA: pyridoxal 5'-phosphate synthase glutaminase subunit PdxT [Planctomycetota bacterium]|nr:pyridoxal 5'-phosphate synthase glutaminase subunit PdxT [Planctomycetota bacterium]